MASTSPTYAACSNTTTCDPAATNTSLLGHAKASMTLDVYADLFDEDQEDVAANLDVAVRLRSEGPKASGELTGE